MLNSLKRRLRAAGFTLVKVPLRSGETRLRRFLLNAMRATGYVVFKPRSKNNGPEQSSWHENAARAADRHAADIPNRGNGAERPSRPADPRTNRMEDFAAAFAGIEPWKGHVPKGFLIDFLGTLTDATFRTMWGIDPASTGDSYHETTLPTLPKDGEGWFEAFSWVTAAREAKDRFVMLTLGACYGAQAVGSYRALMRLNPMPCKLVAVEPNPGNAAWIKKHFRDNGIDPDDHWIIESAMSDRSAPVLFPVGAAGWGTGNCVWTNDPGERRLWANQLIYSGFGDDAIESLLVDNRTGLKVPLTSGPSQLAELQYVSAVTLNDVLAPFEHVDYIEADLQHSELLVFPPAMAQLKRKVRLIHIGTHSEEGHRQLHEMFAAMGWDIVFSFEPRKNHETALGSFWANDGVLTVKNPGL